jgi:hypothetical protein
MSIVRATRKHVVALVAFALLVITTASASAAAWKYASWGKGWATVVGIGSFYLDRLDGQIADTSTDGYCVYLRYRESGQSWPGKLAKDGKACTSTPVTVLEEGTHIVGVRMYRGDGHYLTLWGN